MTGHHHAHAPGDARARFRADEEVAFDWARLFARQEERASLVEDWWRMLDGRPGLRIADVGTGPGAYAIRLARMGAEVAAIELSQAPLDHMLAHGGRGLVTPIVHDAESGPIPGAPYDVALATHMLHHVRDHAALLRNLRASARVLLMSDFDPDTPCEIGPPRDVRIPAKDAIAWAEEAGWVPSPPVHLAYETWAFLARRAD